MDMTNTELRAKIVEMLNCDEIHAYEGIRRDCEKLGRQYVSKAEYRVLGEETIEKYEEVIAFILNELDNEKED